jgi:aminodeoxychorismate synthase component I
MSDSIAAAQSVLDKILRGDAEGVVFDGAGFDGFCAAEPAKILVGDWQGWNQLDDAVAALRSGVLAGWFDYEGNYCFGHFPSVHDAADLKWPKTAMRAGASFQPGMDRKDWVRRVRTAREYIAAGDIYQVNLTHTLTSAWTTPAAAFYPQLRAASPAPYSCLLRLGDTTVLSTSPECFLQIDGRRIMTRPIKGTRPRRADDQKAAQELLDSPKERAELIMITDLERNDLGQVCDFGSVQVTGLCQLETFAQVHHLVSTIEGRLRPDISPVQAVRACYPGGSITGAPKKRAREIIAELEPVPRGLYTGAIGYFSADGRAVFNIAIRTLVVAQDRATFGVGAGIVADSDPAAEYEETLHKAAGLFAALS